MTAEIYITQVKPKGGAFAGTILLVDDFEAHLEVMTAVLEQEGYRVIATTDGVEALNRIYELSPDMAILDVMMPGIGGLDLCRGLKGIYKNRYFPVMLLTGLNQAEDRIDGIDAGADEYFTKPYSPREMVKKIRALFQVKKLKDELDSYEDVIFHLALAAENRLFFMRGHSERVSVIASHIAAELKLDGAVLADTRRGGILHDIGMSGIDERIINKTDALTAQELDIIRAHPTAGFDLCKNIESLGGALSVIRHHHERWDGRGYPRKLKGDAIPLPARIVGLANAFDAMVSDRPYKKKLAVQEAVAVIAAEKKSGQWDPDMVEAFEAIASEKSDFSNLISNLYK